MNSIHLLSYSMLYVTAFTHRKFTLVSNQNHLLPDTTNGTVSLCQKTNATQSKSAKVSFDISDMQDWHLDFSTSIQLHPLVDTHFNYSNVKLRV